MLSDEELMASYVAGDRDAFDELFRRYAPLLLRVMQNRMGRPEDARDLVQQTFLQLHRSRADFRQGALLRPWLLTIALNLKRRHFRRLNRTLEVSIDLALEELPDRASPANELEAAREVRSALAELPDAQRTVIQMHWMQGLPFTEVATAVGATLAAVKVRAHRGYAAIRGNLLSKPRPDRTRVGAITWGGSDAETSQRQR